MNAKLPVGIILSLFLFCHSVLAEKLQAGPVYSGQTNGVSLAATLPASLEIPPKSSDFKLLAGNRLIKAADEIEPFAGSGKQLVILFCVDVSRSLNKSLLKETQDALINIFSETSPNIRYLFGLVSFADSVSSASDFTEDPDTLIQSIRALKIAPKKGSGNKTLLYQAIIDSLNKLNTLEPAEYRRILIISDGKDEGSIETHDSVINLSNTLGIPLDAIGRGIIPKQYADELSGLAKATGGRFIYPREESLSLKEAIIRIHKSFIENTWVVHFNYTPDPAKPKLENLVIQFQPNNASGLSSALSGSIPDIGLPPPQLPDTEVPSPLAGEKDPDQTSLAGLKEQFFKYFPLIGGGALTLATVIFILWIVLGRKNNEQPGDTELMPDIPAGRPPPSVPLNEKKRRQTEVMTDLKFQQQFMPGWVLEIIEGPLEGQKIPIDKQRFRIGANRDNDLILVDDYVSGNHALLSYENGALLLSDLHSRNGIRLNGEWIKDKTVPVVPGNVIHIGNSTFKVTEKERA